MPRHNAFRGGRVHVCARLCETCIFRPGQQVVSQERVDGMVERSIKNDSAIICHSTLTTEENSVCRGFYERHGDETLALRAAKALDLTTFVEPPPKY